MRDAAGAAAWIDLRAASGAETGGVRGDARTISAGALVDALISDTPARAALRIRGAKISGRFDLSRADATCPVEFEDCHFEEGVSLREARVPSVAFRSCHVPALDAYQLETRGDVDLACSTVSWVDLSGARVSGRLRLDRLAVTGSRDGVALDASGIDVSAEMLCRELTTSCGEFRVMDGHIAGELSLNGARLSNKGKRALRADGLRVDASIWASRHNSNAFRAEGEVRLIGASAGRQVNFSGARLASDSDDALVADRLRVGVAIFEEVRALGEVSVMGAHIAGELRFGGARIINPRAATDPAHARALSMDFLEAQAVDCKGLQAVGQVRLRGVRVEGPLRFDDARVANSIGATLLADGARINDDASFQRLTMEVEGIPGELKDSLRAVEVRLIAAHIGGALDFSGAHLVNPNGPALVADFVQVGRSAIFRNGFTSEHIRLSSARIGQQLLLDDATVQHIWLASVHADELWLPAGRKPDRYGVVVLTDARVRMLSDKRPRTATAFRYRPLLAGFQYESLARDSEDLETRLEWLADVGDQNPEDGDRTPESGMAYFPQAYDQLESVLRHAGREGDARKVAIVKHRRRRKSLGWAGWLFNLAADGLVGYGYRTYRAAIILAALIAASAIVFAIADRSGDMQRLKPDAEAPDFHSWLYALDAVLPIVSFGQESAWSPVGFALGWYAFVVLMGWLLTTAVVAALTASLFRE